MIDLEIKQKWLEALRSGKYQQGRSCLHRGAQFCCLGVLCDVINPEGWDDGEMKCFWYNGSFSAGFLPPLLSIELKIHDLHEGRLINMNDDGATFEEIADYIESHDLSDPLSVTNFSDPC